MKSTRLLLAFLMIGFTFCAKEEKPKTITKTLEVTATAYNTTPAQTKNYAVGIAAWGDTLKPGMKSIAVSRDLIKMGLDHNQEVKIEGLEGTYLVKDKMNKRWKKKIDIYMGLDEKAARQWGKQQVTIHWEMPLPDALQQAE